jgi:hypothetical protein
MARAGVERASVVSASLACVLCLVAPTARAQLDGESTTSTAPSTTEALPPPPSAARADAEEEEEDDDSDAHGAGDDGGAGEAVEADATGAAESAESADEETTSGPSVSATFGGYVEANYTYALNQPSNGVIAFRGFDNQHNTFTLANVALTARLDYDRVYAEIALQYGNTPTTYYLAEPGRATPIASGIPTAGPSDQSTWRFLQVAYAGWSIPVDGWHVVIEGGLFLSPVGFESMAVASNWNFSRSNLFYGCPFYHSGVHVAVSPNSEWTFTAGLWNGWNTLLDNNDEKSFSLAADFVGTNLSAHLLYFSGVERSPGWAGGGRPWRHLFDAYVRGDIVPELSLALHATAGFENGATMVGMSSWEAVAGYVHIAPLSWFSINLRGDFFRDSEPGALAASDHIFWPTEWVSGTTVTLVFQPVTPLTFYVEYRHDHAAGNTFFAGSVQTDPMSMTPILNSPTQDTLTVGVSANVSGIRVGG